MRNKRVCVLIRELIFTEPLNRRQNIKSPTTFIYGYLTKWFYTFEPCAHFFLWCSNIFLNNLDAGFDWDIAQ